MALKRDEIEAIRERCSSATPGPWEAYDRDGGADTPTTISVCGSDIEGPPEAYLDRGRFGKHADAAFCAHARTDVPALLAHIEEQQATIARLRAALKEVQWLPGPDYTRTKVMECPCCLQADYQGHAGDCLISWALADTEGGAG